MIRFFLALLFGLLFALSLPAQDTSETDEAASEETTGETSEDPLKLQRDILNFGITSEVVELLESLETNRDRRLESEVLELLEGDVPVDIQVGAFEYFDAIESPEAVSRGTDVLSLSDELPDRLVLTFLRYLRNLEDQVPLEGETVEALKSLSDSSDQEISRQALRLMGSSDSDEALTYLIE